MKDMRTIWVLYGYYSTLVNSLVTLMITRESGSCRARLIGGGGQPSLVGDTQQIQMEIICHKNLCIFLKSCLIGGGRATFSGGRYSTDRNGNYLPRKHLNPEPSRTLVYFCNYVDFGSREELFLSQR